MTSARHIVLENVSHSYDGRKTVLKSVSLEIGTGITALLGLNGAGKSTMLALLSGRMSPSEGRVRIMGMDPVEYSLEVRRRMGVVPENVPLVPQLSPLEHFGLMAEIHGQRDPAELIEKLELSSHLQIPAAHLSKGFSQRLAIALALYHDPDVLLLDEPTSGLDPAQQDAFIDMLSSLASERAILFSTHIIPEAARVASRVLVVSDGRIVYDGPPEEVDLRDAVLRGHTTPEPDSTGNTVQDDSSTVEPQVTGGDIDGRD